MDLWVVGGEQRIAFRELEEWRHFKTALVVKVEEGVPRRALEHETPPELRPEGEASHCFKAATFENGTAYLCTNTEVLVCDAADLAVRRIISLPCFNDLHHVAPGPDGSLWVAVTGLDAVARLSPEGELLRLYDVLGGDVWDRFSPDVDYRRVPSTKPHRSHPNYVFFRDGQPWVTRFEQRDAVPLGSGGGRGEPIAPIAPIAPIQLGPNGIHDGHLHGGRVFFTSVDGRVTSFDLADGSRRELDLNSLSEEPDRPLGWCRGLLPLGRRAWVGFTSLRYTKLRKNLSWIRHGFRETEHHRVLPTRIALYDLEEPALLEEVDLQPVGMGAVFSIHET